MLWLVDYQLVNGQLSNSFTNIFSSFMPDFDPYFDAYGQFIYLIQYESQNPEYYFDHYGQLVGISKLKS
ncbi:hypothetical protein [Desulfotomaculum nigrificans]|uniref:hypothetical protein n=1 Tax=Desulfotomaculum nigrificans TaxID=1565 RepID=UPI001FA710E2|nr:hypothetical protein [Desulfotomaculum nigrificans]